VHAGDALLLSGALDGADLIPIDRRPFVFELVRSTLHSSIEVDDQLVVPPIEKPSDVGDLCAIFVRVDLQDTRRRAALDLMLKTGSRTLTKLGVGASPELKVSID
jgi:hypothetical protein